MEDLTNITAEKPRGKPFEPGNNANPDGRPKGSKNYLTQLEEAVLKYETEKGKKLFDRLIERAFANDMVLLSVAKKFVADKTSTEISGADGEPIIINLVPVKNKEEIDNLNGD